MTDSQAWLQGLAWTLGPSQLICGMVDNLGHVTSEWGVDPSTSHTVFTVGGLGAGLQGKTGGKASALGGDRPGERQP
jgi:hypothetical protein